MSWTKPLLPVAIFVGLLALLAACFQAPPMPVPPEEEPAGGPGIVNNLTVPGLLTAARANVRDSLTVGGTASIGNLSVRNSVSFATLNATELAVDDLEVNDSFVVYATAAISDDLYIGNDLGVMGDLFVMGETSFANTYYPLVLSGSVGGSTPITVPVALTKLPVDTEIGDVYFFSREISGTVVCGLYQMAATFPFTTTEIVSPTVTLATELTIFEGTVVDSTLLANEMVYLACSTEVLGSVDDVMATVWLQ